MTKYTLNKGIVSEAGVCSLTNFKKKNMQTNEVKTRPILSPVSAAGVTNVIIVNTRRKEKHDHNKYFKVCTNFIQYQALNHKVYAGFRHTLIIATVCGYKGYRISAYLNYSHGLWL